MREGTAGIARWDYSLNRRTYSFIRLSDIRCVAGDLLCMQCHNGNPLSDMEHFTC
jgi:hypothetical protein